MRGKMFDEIFKNHYAAMEGTYKKAPQDYKQEGDEMNV